MDEKTIKEMTRDLGKSQALSSIERALGGIRRLGQYQDDWDAPFDIQPKIDKVALSAAKEVTYRYQDLEQALGPLWVDKKKLNKRQPRYRINARRNDKNFRATISTNPEEPYFPSCLISIYPADHLTHSQLKGILVSLHDQLPHLNVSRVEYASDICCKSPRAVQRLFRILTRYIYCPHLKEVTLHEYECGRSDLTIGMRRERSCSFYLGADKDRIIYERGPDRYRVDGACPFEKLDRLRLEARLRPKFVKKGPCALGDFLNHAGFYRLNKDAWQFRRFKESPRLPQLWEDYVARDEKGKALGSFHADYLRLRKQIPNISQYTMRVSEFDPLMERLFEVWKQFDSEWESYQPRGSATTRRGRGI